MSIRAAVLHRTEYTYDRPVDLAPQVIRLRPAPHARTPVSGYAMKLTLEHATPAGGVRRVEPFVNWQQDPQANWLARVVVPEAVTRFAVEVSLRCDLSPINPFDFFLDAEAETFPIAYGEDLARQLAPYLERAGAPACGSGFDAMLREVRGLVAPTGGEEPRTIDAVTSVNRRVQERLGYRLRFEAGIQSPEETIAAASGSCRDSAWLLVQLLRGLGLAARFVSGYSVQLAPDEKPLDEHAAAGVASDVVDLHAWAEVYLPGAGWVGLDATSGMMTGEGHIPLAATAEPGSAAPIEGSFAAASGLAGKPEVNDAAAGASVGVGFDYGVTVVRDFEDPRVTKPFDDAAWSRVDALGRHIDNRLARGDVRLTMGGEPTFVAAGLPAHPAWNTAALGGGKHAMGHALMKLQRARPRWAGSLVQAGQGKWYPGEELPRWSLALHRRRDGVAVWSDADRLADPTTGGPAGEGADLKSEAFVAALSAHLGLDGGNARPAFEDADAHTKRLRALPKGFDLLAFAEASAQADDEAEDAPRVPEGWTAQELRRLAAIETRGLDRPTAVILPLRRARSSEAPARWSSGPWSLAADEPNDPARLELFPGDAPAGLRIPLESLPFEEAEPDAGPDDPVAAAERPLLLDGDESARDPEPPKEVDPSEPKLLVRTALAVEPRGDALRIFLPPIRRLEHFLSLVAAVEAAAAEADARVVVEGYPPPSDPRLETVAATPDPGVLEINVAPEADWPALVDATESLYHDARVAGLSTEKFQKDGRHTGTGGGNHVVVGGRSPLDSPLLRRPDLLRSLVACWHRHPSLSYLFSGLFIGPTSQAPRMDEGRRNAVEEMNLAFLQTPEPGPADDSGFPTPPSREDAAPWLVDRLYRHLLTDLTGNTHRSELCIDKLYSPDSPTGRLGLLEFRGFEMPPHPRLALAQALLLRGLIARCWEEPLTGVLSDFGPALHDRYLLPHWVKRDFDAVLADLGRHGMAFESSWYDAFFEFRFPRLGTATVDGVHIELRVGVEPWLTLGEEASGTGTARYVDSSLERCQVRVSGLPAGDTRRVAVNGVELPLRPTGTAGESVAGVRYRAWQPWSCLHPTIEPHAPVAVDLVEPRWSERDPATGVVPAATLGGCAYSVAHPGGRAEDAHPVNALEAESRRAARFSGVSLHPGTNPLRPAGQDAGLVTLDLRRFPTAARGGG
ncbi:transglutaminase family protein [Phycisphaera mikurensis]|uniref:Transglutaminase-like domain-containing protein n=1 Tax=Phycisphaera mikurensis (strain NBRC 102666 / KCTC 22515 / FYK2301M01) TaxID=1142394 RepID=I0IB25_PHYMF|nr:transglutaminase family protein [Phycisphaera mikurensis]MBB6442566.1 uncharacterized protein (DUF2126 family) [Phycisphaera mikurensis]BAM02463.1 hypothetical protein PSMK_03040 [Phycisphaera mikurensis NBRC 102666]